MAGGKLSPRQKMIGMMYLVLTALLALNVSKEILDAFVTVNKGLETTAASFDRGIGQLYSEFDQKKSIDPLRMQPTWEKAQRVKALSKKLNERIDLLKKRLIRETEGYVNHEGDTIHLQYVNSKDNYDIPTNIMIGASEDGSKGEARNLKQELRHYQNDLLSLLREDVRKDIHFSFDIEDPKDGGDLKTWELKTFYHTPLAASVTILSKIQDDVKSAEQDVLNALMRETESETAREGVFEYSGTIKMTTPKGKQLSYPFASSYIVARPTLTVSADKMNVMYTGLKNPISVSVPGVANENVTVTCSNGTLLKLGNGKYEVQSPQPGKSIVTVTATLPSGEKKSMGTMEFRVKRLPKPEVTISGVMGTRATAAQLGVSPGIVAVYPNTEFEDAKVRTTSFRIEAYQNGVAVIATTINGNMFTAALQGQFRSLRKGTKVYITEIKTSGPDGLGTASDISITIQ
ncbi:MAG: hypothetical protein LW750_06015 [Bacteroidetes bacterium]|nr:hypothetical protein [Bacteroidota bacterium]